MGFFASLFGGHSADAYLDTAPVADVTRNTPEETGVSRYLASHGSTTVSKVDRYLKNQENNQPSGVAKYLARQAILERNKPVVTLTGVAKYLNNNKNSATVIKTGVSKYIDSQEQTTVSGVAKYVLKKTIADRYAEPKSKETRVEHYIKNKPDVYVSGVAKYLAKQSTKTTSQVSTVVVEAIDNTVVLTGVQKYLQTQR
jgi:hypothetical protein